MEAIPKDNKPPKMDAIPKDKYNFVLCTMCLIGITMLLPWNFFITANQYWMYKFRDVNSTNTTSGKKTELQKNFTSYLSISAKVPFVLFLLVNTWINHRFGASLRVGIAIVTCIILFIVTASLVYVDTDSNQTGFLIGTLSSVVVVNVVAAFHLGGGIGIAGALPKKYITSNVYGEGLGGLFAAVVQILTLLGHSSPQESALAYFLIAVVMLGLTLAAFLVMDKSSFYNFYMSMQTGKHKGDKTELVSNARQRGTVLGPLGLDSEDDVTSPLMSCDQQMFTCSRDVESIDFKTIMHIISKIWVHALSIVMIFWIKLAIFPALTVLVDSTDHVLTDKLFLPVICFLNFNVCDVLGRVIATYCPLPKERKYLLLFLCFIRTAFIPLFMLCNINSRVHMSTVFRSDTIFAILVMSLGATNGYFMAVATTIGSKIVEVQYQEKAASMLALSLGVGLTLGAVSSYGLVSLL